MMTEFPNVSQIHGEGQRRWFTDDYFDLIVWYEEGMITGFQLCYDRNQHPRSYTWTNSKGARHNGIDDGDNRLLSYKATPILVADGSFDVAEISRRFKTVSGSLPSDIQEIVIRRLEKQQRRSGDRVNVVP